MPTSRDPAAGRLGAAALLLSAMTVASATAADPAPPDSLDLAQRVAALEQRLAQLPPPAPKDAKGFAWTSADGSASLKLSGYVHSDGRVFVADDDRPATTTLTLRRVRPVLEATVAKRVDVRIMPDWGGGSASLQDGYVEVRAGAGLRIRSGKFKSPVGYERLMSTTAIPFVELALPVNLVPNRDVGLLVSGDHAGGVISWAAGVVDGAPDGGSVDGDLGDDKELVGRVFAFPAKRSAAAAWKGLGVGIAASVGNNHGTPAATGLGALRSPGQQGIFAYRSTGRADSTVVADGRRFRWSPQMSWHAGRVGGFAEYVESSQEIRLGTAALEHEARAWAVTASVALTADEVTARGVSPREPLDASAGRWGALTLDLRLARLVVESSAFPVFASASSSVSEAREHGVGLTWFPHRSVKVLVDHMWTEFDGGAAGGGSRETERVILARTQVAF